MVPLQPDESIAPTGAPPRGDARPTELLRRLGAAGPSAPAPDPAVLEARMADDVSEFYGGARSPLSDVTAAVYGLPMRGQDGADDASRLSG